MNIEQSYLTIFSRLRDSVIHLDSSTFDKVEERIKYFVEDYLVRKLCNGAKLDPPDIDIVHGFKEYNSK